MQFCSNTCYSQVRRYGTSKRSYANITLESAIPKHIVRCSNAVFNSGAKDRVADRNSHNSVTAAPSEAVGSVERLVSQPTKPLTDGCTRVQKAAEGVVISAGGTRTRQPASHSLTLSDVDGTESLPELDCEWDIGGSQWASLWRSTRKEWKENCMVHRYYQTICIIM